MKVETLTQNPDMPQASPDQAGIYHILVSIQGSKQQTLVDVGCNQTSDNQSLI